MPVLIAALAGLALALPAQALAACPGSGLTPDTLSVDQATDAVLCEINQRRKRHGVDGVNGSMALTQAAADHSSAMVEQSFFSHYSPGGTSPVSRIQETGYLARAGWWSIGENIRWGSGAEATPQSAVVAWMNSPSHRRTLLSPRWRHVGIGVSPGSPADVDDLGAATYTADFGARTRG